MKFWHFLFGVPKPPRQWDYTVQGWGHSFTPSNGAGFGNRAISRGDEILLKMRSGRIGRYRIDSIRWCGDPPDMFFAKTTHVGYKEDSGESVARQ